MTFTVSAQQFIGGGITSTIIHGTRRTGPYLEGLLQLGAAELDGLTLGRSEVYAVLFPDPGARFSVLFHPAYFERDSGVFEYIKPFVGVGGQWLNLPGRDEWHSTLTVGAGLPYGASIWIVADEGVVPALGLSKSPAEYPLSIHAYALASHFVYGLTTELVRRAVRTAL